MKVLRRSLVIATMFATALTVTVATTPAQATMPRGGASQATMPRGAAEALTMPRGQSLSTLPRGQVSPLAALSGYRCGPLVRNGGDHLWGKAQICVKVTDVITWSYAVFDAVTDGYCVTGKRLVGDVWVNLSPRPVMSCTTGGWKTIFTRNHLDAGGRVFRGSGGDGGASFYVPAP